MKNHVLKKPLPRFVLPIFWVFLGVLSFSVTAQTQSLLTDTSQPEEVRIQDAISKMSLEEKVSQLTESSPAIKRLGVPAYNWWNEALHGVARSGVATIFPQAIGLAATFDLELMEEVGDAISDEARGLYNLTQARDKDLEEGNRLKYLGLTFWSPNVNIFRDPRWGRGQETYGEDPFLTAELGIAFMKGMQGNDPKYLKTAAGAKHYAVHSGPEELRHGFDTEVSKQDLFSTYLPAFEALVKAGVESVMCAYNAVYGEPLCANKYLMEDILKNEWGFKGYVTSDCGGIGDIYEGHKFVDTPEEAAAIALRRGVHLNCGDTYKNLVSAVEQGLIGEEAIDEAVATLLRTRMKLGMFDPKGSTPYDKLGEEVINSDKNRELALISAEKSIVMLKNDGILPLRKDLPRYFITGPNATSLDALIGNYYGVNNRYTTVLEGVAEEISPASLLRYKQGTLLDRKNPNPLDWSSGEAKKTDATIVVLGLTGNMEGEEGAAIASAEHGDRLDYNLPENQIDYLRRLREDNDKPIIAVITGGSPKNLAPVDSLANAVLLAWYPGEEGGKAVARTIFGDNNPSAKLPVTYPKSLDQLPDFEDYSMQGRTYRFAEATPLYPFGYGLSYATFEYSDMDLEKKTIRAKSNQSVKVRATVTNTGDRAGEEVVQLYSSDERHKGDGVPFFQLKGFQKIHLEPGESKEVTFEITPDKLAVVNKSGETVVNKGKHKIYIGGSLPIARSVELGASEPVSIEINVN